MHPILIKAVKRLFRTGNKVIAETVQNECSVLKNSNFNSNIFKYFINQLREINEHKMAAYFEKTLEKELTAGLKRYNRPIYRSKITGELLSQRDMEKYFLYEDEDTRLRHQHYDGNCSAHDID